MRARSRPLYACLLILTIGCGLLSRSRLIALPSLVTAYAGDTLWSMMIFLACAFLAPQSSTWALAMRALLICFVVELSQLYRAPWINALRHTRLGALALGQGFLWSDLVCYAAGVFLGVGLERLIVRLARSQQQPA